MKKHTLPYLCEEVACPTGVKQGAKNAPIDIEVAKHHAVETHNSQL